MEEDNGSDLSEGATQYCSTGEAMKLIIHPLMVTKGNEENLWRT